MQHCHVCGNSEFGEKLVREVFQIDERTVLVENIPAQVCLRCGEPVFSRQTTERIRQMLHGETRPVRTVDMEVFAYG